MIDASFEKLIKIKQLTVSKILDILKVASISIGTTSPACEFELIEIIANIQYYNRFIDKAEK